MLKRANMFFVALLLSFVVQAETIPDFASYTDVKQKKAAFFDFFYELVLAEGKKVLADRHYVASAELDAPRLKKLCERYSKDCESIDEAKRKDLLKRIDVIPPSLALAQAANESAWGTSRFAKKAKNFYGQWCYKEGCGIVPKRRDPGAKHEVRKFATAQASVAAYIFNLNTGRVYAPLRKVRAKARAAGNQFTGYQLAVGLVQYSERREAYVEEIQSMISYNKLVKKYDERFWQALDQMQLD